jgi:hypothetical protein
LIFRQILSATPEACVLARKGALWQEPAARGTVSADSRISDLFVPGMLP